MASKSEYQMLKWKQVIEQMTRLIELNAPECIKANHLVTLIIPRLVTILGVTNEFGEQLGRMLANGLGAYTGLCIVCKKADAIRGEDCCPKCLAEVDQMATDADLDTNDLGEEFPT